MDGFEFFHRNLWKKMSLKYMWYNVSDTKVAVYCINLLDFYITVQLYFFHIDNMLFAHVIKVMKISIRASD